MLGYTESAKLKIVHRPVWPAVRHFPPIRVVTLAHGVPSLHQGVAMRHPGMILLVVPAIAVAVAVPVHAAGEQVTYLVNSEGPIMTVTFFNAMNRLTTLKNLPSSWSTTFAGNGAGQLRLISAQSSGPQVSCKVVIDGQVAVQQSAVGRYNVATCTDMLTP